jgi:hypothetical protein
MASERDAPSVTDYAVTALSPVLIMLMVGSLTFFLVEVLYAGKYSGRLLYTLFFFVSAAVLVARVSIQQGSGRAAVYGLALGGATYVALLAYVEYPTGWLKSWGWLVNLGLMLLVWWSAHKLTWDCTHIDERQESSGRGLLNAAGLDADATEGTGGRSQESGQKESGDRKQESGKKKGKKKKQKKGEHDSKLWAWIERYKAHKEKERKAGHTPGVWVLYFALAALPLFALGQSLISPDDAARRQASFLQMTVYIGSALMLLVTTSLLGVRRYLRQRKAKVPTAMTASWLGLGALIVCVFLVVGAFLPRPHSEVPWFGISRAGKKDRDASRYAQTGGAAGKGDGRAGNESKAGDGSASGKGGQPGGGNKGEKGGSGNGQGGKGGKGGKSDQSGGNTKGGGKGKDGESEAKKDEDGGKSGGNDTEADDKESDEDGGSRDAGGSQSPQLGGALEKIAGVVKWIVFAIIAVLIIFGLFFGFLKYLAPFTGWARRWLEGIRAWWANLFGKANRDRKVVGAETLAPQGPVRPPPFSEYSNPFADGSAETRDTGELIAYTFEALDAWAWDRDAGRAPTETPMEFAERLSAEFAPLAVLVTRSAYSELPLPKNALAVLESAWEQMVHGVAVGA